MSEVITELKPCPFCGYLLTTCEGVCEKEVEGSEEYQFEFTGICCPGCAVFLPKQNESDTASDGIALWNSRHSDNLARIVVEYDDLLRRYEGPSTTLFAGDVAKIDAAYDNMIAAARSNYPPTN